ncbi:DeoR faimly transcriptional regulator [Klebsiella sp. RIT-PI-d]|uniref:diguanylate cyclase n=1 Tax=Klebsiella sp. RIT-PI-d TaxID=1681196 RepID=UPI00067655B8|nr:diguanylate cyclase [Klebsiella sp. RIT-PI-d]KNC11285.1 DeoR faimly transcriptional regulator [Klebsiella sp. RIT-PI-d]
MRIATITNFAYIATVVLTIASGVALFMASDADRVERAAVKQSRDFDAATEQLQKEAFAQTSHARLAVIHNEPENIQAWRAGVDQDLKLERHLAAMNDVGASAEELILLRDGIALLKTLEDEQQDAITALEQGRKQDAIQLLFSADYERQLSQVEYRFAHFESLINQRAEATITEATHLSQRLRTLSEIMVGLTALLFLFVLGFIIKHRILRPVVTLSDIVNRLATQDYAVEAPIYAQVDEIGDMAQAIRIFRENGMVRQQLEQERDADWVTRNLLARMTQRLQGCESHRSIINVISLFAPKIVPEMGGRLYILDPQNNTMKCMASWLQPAGDATPFAPECCWALKRGQLHSPSRDNVDMPCEHYPLQVATKAICVPLIAQNKPIGLLTFDNHISEKEPPYIYLELMAETLSLALANQKLRDTLTEKAMFDPLTGLRNRHNQEEILRELIERAETKKSCVSCLMIDIDYFKKLNDTWGHGAGDKVLRETGRVISELLDESGVAFRYGGEEFLILLPDLDETQAKHIAEQILYKVSQHKMVYELHDVGPISVSIGLATWPTHARESNLVRAADLALYLAKERGRNQIVVAKKAS